MIKYAEGLRNVLVHAPLCIDPGRELAPTGRLIVGPWAPIFNGLIVAPRRQQGDSKSGLNPFHDYWKAYDVDRAVRETLDAEGRQLFAVNGRDRYQHLFSSWQGHATLDYGTILRRGLPWYRDKIRRGIEEAERTASRERLEFFHALGIVLSATEELVYRYASACEEHAATVAGHASRRLRRLAEVFHQLINGRPSDFFGALEFTHFMNALDGYDNVGRLDQYLYPFYRADVDQATLTPDQAEDLLAEAFEIWGENGHWQVVVGGTDQNGEDASNELTMLILKARGRVKRPQPSLSLRLSVNCSSTLMDSALDLLGAGVGQPAFYHDDLYIQSLQQIGLAREAAAEFVFGGCTETHIAGKSAIRDAFFNLTKALEGVFYNGKVSFDGARFGVETGPPQELGTFEAFLTAYRRQVEYLVNVFVRYRNHVQKIVAKLQPALIRSIFVSGCLDSGRNHTAGGSEHDYGMVDVYGIPNVANSLLAVRKLVYEDRCVSISELVEALRRNFQGYETLRQTCLRLPKYGNANDEVDAIAVHVADHVFSYVLRHRLWNGDGYYAFCASAPGAHVVFGKTTGATPDGRLAGTALANSIGPMQGTDCMGPTAMLRSVAKLPLCKSVGTPVVNLSLSPSLLDVRHRDVVSALIRTFFRLGGMQLQLNVVDRSTLLEAVKHPEAHRSLIVRVAGYSARFTQLAPEIQQEIISRTVHDGDSLGDGIQ